MESRGDGLGRTWCYLLALPRRAHLPLGGTAESMQHAPCVVQVAAVRRVACDAQHLEPATRAMVRAMRYTGVGCVDAKWDSDGLPKVCARVYPLVVPVTWHMLYS